MKQLGNWCPLILNGPVLPLPEMSYHTDLHGTVGGVSVLNGSESSNGSLGGLRQVSLIAGHPQWNTDNVFGGTAGSNKKVRLGSTSGLSVTDCLYLILSLN